MVDDSDKTLNLFLRGFAARDLATPLPSCDEGASVDTLRAVMTEQRIDVVGMRQRGGLTCWISREKLDGSPDVSPQRFDPAMQVSDGAALNEVIERLSRHPFVFVRSFGQIAGLIRRDDLDRPAMRMWLFGLVTIMERRVTRAIGERFPDETWAALLSAGRLEKARTLREERRRRHQNPDLLDCLQFADKGDIIARDEQLRQFTRFRSRREVESFVKGLQDLRNNLAHSQDLTANWDVVVDLATNLHRIVLGPEAEAADKLEAPPR
ncbi:MAG: hypothetical protein IT428_01365 [Planctomycetaceae bacterium]|nr:hypothetical protein [Planctomycetaceae bacterium]